MTTTTELLKEIESWNYIEETMPQEHRKNEFTCSISTLGNIKNKSELRGRLDALKEEVEFLSEIEKGDTNFYLNDKLGFLDILLKKQLVSIQEEIKLIEGKI